MTTNLPKLHFLHANSYPAGTYGEFFRHLAPYYVIDALEMHAHDPVYPVEDGWDALVLESIAAIEQRHREPVILVGHSLGGMLSMMVARQRPDLVRCVVMLDSPVVAGWRALVLRLVRLLGQNHRFSPGRFSVKRRNVWPDAQAAYQHFASKQLFAAWAPNVLNDYMKAGLVPHPDGVTLRFTREIETAVYDSLPHHLGRIARAPFPVAIGFIQGRDSAECRQAGLAATHALVGDHFTVLDGGHLFPMESPASAAQAVHAMINNLLAGAAR